MKLEIVVWPWMYVPIKDIVVVSQAELTQKPMLPMAQIYTFTTL